MEANGGIEGNSSDNFEYSSEVQGLVNFSGGLNDSGWIDENDPPFVSVHDDMDGVVPYGSDFAKIFGIPIIYMEGSGKCHEVGDSLGIVNQLKTVQGMLVTLVMHQTLQRTLIIQLHLLLISYVMVSLPIHKNWRITWSQFKSFQILQMV